MTDSAADCQDHHETLPPRLVYTTRLALTAIIAFAALTAADVHHETCAKRARRVRLQLPRLVYTTRLALTAITAFVAVTAMRIHHETCANRNRRARPSYRGGRTPRDLR